MKATGTARCKLRPGGVVDSGKRAEWTYVRYNSTLDLMESDDAKLARWLIIDYRQHITSDHTRQCPDSMGRQRQARIARVGGGAGAAIPKFVHCPSKSNKHHFSHRCNKKLSYTAEKKRVARQPRMST